MNNTDNSKIIRIRIEFLLTFYYNRVTNVFGYICYVHKVLQESNVSKVLDCFMHQEIAFFLGAAAGFLGEVLLRLERLCAFFVS